MSKYECSTTVRAVPDIVWRYLGDVAWWPHWQFGVIGAELIGEFAGGGQIRLHHVFATENLLTLVEVAAAQRIVVTERIGQAIVHYEYRLEEAPAGFTSLAHRVEVDDLVDERWLMDRLVDDLRYGVLALAALADPALRR